MTGHLDAGPPFDDLSVADVYDRITDGVFVLDDQWRFAFLDEQAESLLRRDEATLLGEVIWEAFPGLLGSTFQTEFERAREMGEPRTFEAEHPSLDRWFETRAYPSADGLTVHVDDVTDRVSRTDELERRAQGLRRAYEVVAATDQSFDARLESLLEVVRRTVGTDYATLSRIHDDEYVFEAVATPPDADLEAGDTTNLGATNCERVVETKETLVLRDVAADAPELADRAGNAEWGISCYLGAPVTVDGEVYGTFCFYDMEARSTEFSDWEVAFVELMSNWVGYELERRRRTNRLAALNELGDVVREITDAVIDQSTREEIETVACERLAATDSYAFAWVGEVDTTTNTLECRTAAGAGAFPGDTTVPLAPTDGAASPVARAATTGELQTVQYAQRDAHETPDAAIDHDYRSVAAVPVGHESTTYGVLAIYADRPNAFSAHERSVVTHLGAVLGHAIAAVERKRALAADSVVELEFRVDDALADRHHGDAFEGRVVYDDVVPVDDAFLVYGRGSPEGVASLAAVAAEKSTWGAVERIHETEDEVTFHLRVTERPVLATIASLGGSVEAATLDDGALEMTVHLPPGTDTRRVVEAVRDRYPDGEMVAQRQVTRTTNAADRVTGALTEACTARQREALRVAYAAGLFEYPRKSTGEDVADQLGIASPTFQQHIRAAENKIFRALFESPDGQG